MWQAAGCWDARAVVVVHSRRCTCAEPHTLGAGTAYKEDGFTGMGDRGRCVVWKELAVAAAPIRGLQPGISRAYMLCAFQ